MMASNFFIGLTKIALCAISASCEQLPRPCGVEIQSSPEVFVVVSQIFVDFFQYTYCNEVVNGDDVSDFDEQMWLHDMPFSVVFATEQRWPVVPF